MTENELWAQFASAALCGLLARQVDERPGQHELINAAHDAAVAAEAMLKSYKVRFS